MTKHQPHVIYFRECFEPKTREWNQYTAQKAGVIAEHIMEDNNNNNITINLNIWGEWRKTSKHISR